MAPLDLVKVDATEVVQKIISSLSEAKPVSELKRQIVELALGSVSRAAAEQAPGWEAARLEIENRLEQILLSLHMNGLLEDTEIELEQSFSEAEKSSFHDQLQFLSAVVDVTRSADSRWGLQRRLRDVNISVILNDDLGKAYVRSVSQIGIGNLKVISFDSLDTTFIDDIQKLSSHTSITSQVIRRSETKDYLSTETADLVVVVLDEPQRSLLLQINDAAWTRRLPVLYSWRELAKLVVGPWVIPQETGCLRCYFARRLAATEIPELEEEYLRSTEERLTHNPDLLFPLLRDWAASSIVFETMRIVSFHVHPVTARNGLLEIDLLTGTTLRRQFLRLPFCFCSSES